MIFVFFQSADRYKGSYSKSALKFEWPGGLGVDGKPLLQSMQMVIDGVTSEGFLCPSNDSSARALQFYFFTQVYKACGTFMDNQAPYISMTDFVQSWPLFGFRFTTSIDLKPHEIPLTKSGSITLRYSFRKPTKDHPLQTAFILGTIIIYICICYAQYNI